MPQVITPPKTIALQPMQQQKPHSESRIPRPVLAFTADEEGFLIVRCSVVSGSPHIILQTANCIISGDVEESTRGKLSLETSDEEFRKNLTFLLNDIREQVTHEMESKRSADAIAIRIRNAAPQSADLLPSTHVNVTIYRQKATKKAWQLGAFEITPATHGTISIPLDMPMRKATSKLDGFLDSIRRVACREKGCSP